MLSALSSGALLALLAAGTWGGGDFSGGVGAKAAGTTRGAVQMIVLAHAMSLALLACLLLLTHGLLPHGAAMWWGLGGGASVAVSLVAFYLALARGAMGASAAISGLLAAAIPAAVSAGVEGSPGVLRLAGFLLAGIAIWVIVAGSPEEARLSGGTVSRNTMMLAVLGGLGFGVYFVCLRQANSLGVLQPLALCRSGSIVVCALMLAVLKRTPNDVSMFHMNRGTVLGAVGIATLDAAGNLFFIAATRMGRLDVASVLASLYPVTTILLAAWQLHERPSRRQLVGMLVALVAVVMITV